MTDTSSAPVVKPDTERVDRIVAALRVNKLDALLCSVPSHILLLTGYWPVMANTVALFTAEKAMHLLLPEDEEEIAAQMSAALRTSFHPGSLSHITNAQEAISQPLIDLAHSLGLDHARIGMEWSGSLDPSSYLAQFHYGSALRDIVQSAFPHCTVSLVDDLLNQLSMTKTPRELDHLRCACKIAQAAYEAGSEALQIGLREPQAAELLRSAFATALLSKHPVRADAFFFLHVRSELREGAHGLRSNAETHHWAGRSGNDPLQLQCGWILD